MRVLAHKPLVSPSTSPLPYDAYHAYHALHARPRELDEIVFQNVLALDCPGPARSWSSRCFGFVLGRISIRALPHNCSSPHHSSPRALHCLRALTSLLYFVSRVS